jgi:hypothetical protein
MQIIEQSMEDMTLTTRESFKVFKNNFIEDLFANMNYGNKLIIGRPSSSYATNDSPLFAIHNI